MTTERPTKKVLVWDDDPGNKKEAICITILPSGMEFPIVCVARRNEEYYLEGKHYRITTWKHMEEIAEKSMFFGHVYCETIEQYKHLIEYWGKEAWENGSLFTCSEGNIEEAFSIWPVITRRGKTFNISGNSSQYLHSSDYITYKQFCELTGETPRKPEKLKLSPIKAFKLLKEGALFKWSDGDITNALVWDGDMDENDITHICKQPDYDKAIEDQKWQEVEII